MAYNRPTRFSMSVRPVLHILNYELRLLSISKKSLPPLTYALLQLTLKLLGGQPSCRRNHFFSFTETSSDYSLILDSVLFQELKILTGLELVEVAGDIWRPLIVEIGAFGSLTGISKIAANVIGPLADQNVSVFCLSTNQEDYVMVKEKDLSKALSCLSRGFKLVTDSNKESDHQLIERISSGYQQQLDSTVYNTLSTRPIVHPFTCTASKFHVCSILPSTLSLIAQPLLQLMFYNPRSFDISEDPFFSLSIIEDDVSMVLDARDTNKFPEDCVYSSEAYWKVIKIGNGPLGFDECGIVAQVSAPLAQAEISTYYICTFYNDHTLVPENSVSKALQLLNKFLLRTVETTPTFTNGLHTPHVIVPANV